MSRTRIAIIGADISAFHLFNKLYRSDDRYEVACFLELHHSNNYDTLQNLVLYPQPLSGELYPKGIDIYNSYPYKASFKEYKSLDKCIFSPLSVTSPQYLFATAEVIAMDCSVITHGLETIRLPPPKALVSFFSSTQFDIPIILKMLEFYKSGGIKPVIAMPGPLALFTSKDSKVDYFFFIKDLKDYEMYKHYFKRRHEIQTIEKLLESGYQIYFIYDFEQFSSEALRNDDFNLIFFVGFNSLPCFYESHLVVFACDDFTFGDEITAHPSYILCQQADVIIYAHLGPQDSYKQIAERTKKKLGSSIICVEVKSNAKNFNCYPGKTALLVDDSYPTHFGNSARSISSYLAKNCKMVPYDLISNTQHNVDESEIIYGTPSDKDWPAIILSESTAGVTNINEDILPNYKNFDIIVSSTSVPCGLKPPHPIQVMQFTFDVDLHELSPDQFLLPPGAFVRRR